MTTTLFWLYSFASGKVEKRNSINTLLVHINITWLSALYGKQRCLKWRSSDIPTDIAEYVTNAFNGMNFVEGE